MCGGYIEVITDPTMSVGPKLVGASRESINDDGMTVCVLERTEPVNKYNTVSAITEDSAVHC